MTNELWLLLAICLFGLVATVGIFLTKTPGFGRFTTSILLLVLVLVFGSMFFSIGKIESPLFANIAFAVIGFAGGLFTGNRDVMPKKETPSTNAPEDK